MALGTAEEKTGNFRLPLPQTEEEFKALKHLSDEEKALGVRNLAHIPRSDGWLVLGNDPEAQALWHIVELGIIKLLEPDNQALPHSPANLICWEVARFTGCEWMLAIMSVATKTTGEMLNLPSFDVAQLGLHGHPESKLWNDEQRLALQFTRACLEQKMTDELWRQALETWGVKKTLRYMLWIGFVYTWATIENAVNLTWEHGPDPFSGLNEQVASGMQQFDAKWEALKKLF